LFDRTGKQQRVIDNAVCYRSTPSGYTYLIDDTIFINDSRFGVVDGNVACPVMDATGSFLIVARVRFGTLNSISKIDIATRTETVLEQLNDGRFLFADPAISSDNKTLAIIRFPFARDASTEVWVMSTAGTNSHRVQTWPRIFGLTWLNDNVRLAGVQSVGRDGNYDDAGLFVVDTRDGSIKKIANHPVYAVSWLSAAQR
ncbi:MAG TPA: hypothetical protein VM100_00405, partial [Longimicrobiales bacterium]|nr:hypothetical protein [Longimicrobiales bacterium]